MYYAIVRDSATIVNGNAYYQRIFTNVESGGAHSVWAEARK